MLIGAFLTHLETERGNSAATRNARLTAIRALFRYASLRAPEHAALIARVLAIPAKRTDTTIVCFFTQDETDALIAAAAATGSWHGHRDHALLALAAQTGLRVSELTGLRIGDIHLGSGPHVYCRGKGRRDRCTPLTPSAVGTLAAWLAEHGGQPGDPLFPTQAGNPLSRDAVARLLTKYVQLASASCPGLKGKTVSPHTLRHSAAMALEGRGVASDASFGSSREHALPATQRAALCALGLPGRRRGCGDLGLHGPPGSDATMMRLIQLRGPHHHCACWHRDASGNSQMHRVHHHLTQPAAAAGTAAATDTPDLRITGRATRPTWELAALVAPHASLPPETDVRAAVGPPVSHAARRRADPPRTWPPRIAVADRPTLLAWTCDMAGQIRTRNHQPRE